MEQSKKKYYIVRDEKTQEGGEVPFKYFGFQGVFANPMMTPFAKKDPPKVIGLPGPIPFGQVTRPGRLFGSPFPGTVTHNVTSPIMPVLPGVPVTGLRTEPFEPGVADLRFQYLRGPPLATLPFGVSLFSDTKITFTIGGFEFSLTVPYKQYRLVHSDFFNTLESTDKSKPEHRVYYQSPTLTRSRLLNKDSIIALIEKWNDKTKYDPIPKVYDSDIKELDFIKLKDNILGELKKLDEDSSYKKKMDDQNKSKIRKPVMIMYQQPQQNKNKWWKNYW